MIKHEFVEFIPDQLKERVIYVSIPYNMVAHQCCCGCENEVITPLSPTDWKITFDGESISLYPSIGNWNFDCKSHYWITNNQIRWADKWTEKEISKGRIKDRKDKKKYYQSKNPVAENELTPTHPQTEEIAPKGKPSFWSWIKKQF